MVTNILLEEVQSRVQVHIIPHHHQTIKPQPFMGAKDI